MLVLVVCFGCALGSGSVAWCMAAAWWRSDAGTPTVNSGQVNLPVHRYLRAAYRVHADLRAKMATIPLLAALGIVAVAGWGLFGVILEMVRVHRGLADFDASAARFGATHATIASTQVLRVVTQFGGAYVLVPIAVIVGVVEGRRFRSWATVAFLAIVVTGQYVLADVIKVAVGRARPDLLRLTGFSGPSFPSGHATAASAVFTAFALLIGRGRSQDTKAILVGVSVAGIALITASRVTLGVHWLTDVLGSICLGGTWFAITSIAFGGRRLRLGAQLDTAADPVDGVTAPLA